MQSIPGDALPTRFGAEARDFTGAIDDFGPLDKAMSRTIKKNLKVMCREMQFGIAVAQLALADSGLSLAAANLDRVARVLRPGGVFRFASDVEGYVNWALLRFREHDSFEWVAESAASWRSPWPAWPGTRYESKALAQGRQPAYLTFLRT